MLSGDAEIGNLALRLRLFMVSGNVPTAFWFASGNQLARRLRRFVLGFGNGRILCGTLVASTTSVRLLFCGVLGEAVWAISS